MKRPLTLLVLLFALVLSVAACGGDDDDDKSSSGSDSASTASEDGEDEDGEEGAGTDAPSEPEESEPLEPEEARREGNPEVFARIASTTDCAKLQDELEAHEANTVTRRDAGDERRASILEEYAAATKERMSELSCPGSEPAT